MGARFIIREAREGDMDALVELLGMLFSLESDFAPDPARQRQGLALMLRPGPAHSSVGRLVLVAAGAADAARVLGMATAQVVISTAEGAPALLVEDVVLRPEARGLGAGRALMARIEDWGRRLGATRMQLLTDKDNAPAFGFYDACGFSTTNLVCLRRLIPANGK